MKVCLVTSECVPYVKTGGLADVSGALPKALQQQGCEVKIFLPLYASINKEEQGLIPVKEMKDISIPIGNEAVLCSVWYGKLPGTDIKTYLIDCPKYYHRPTPYTEDKDEDERFILLEKAVIQFLQRMKWAPDIIHCNDWQSSLLPVYLKRNFNKDSFFSKTASLLTIHNIGYQGRFPRESILKAGLSYDNFYPGGPYELDDKFCFLKVGIVYSGVITTVSETYAQEIQTSVYGAGLEGVVASRRQDLTGILNGIDTSIWNPSVDEHIPFNYSINSISKKIKNKQSLLEYTNLPFNENIPTIGMITRLAAQKGLELLQPILRKLMKLPLQMVVLGSGEKKYETFLRRTAKTYPNKFFAYTGFNNQLAHLITAGCDMFLMPSRYEPCGLNQMYCLNYGTISIVRKTGGLADTVKDYHEYYKEGNGFSFIDYTPKALYLTIQRAMDMFHNKEVWKKMMKRGMREDFSWNLSAKRYIELYKKAIQKRSDS